MHARFITDSHENWRNTDAMVLGELDVGHCIATSVGVEIDNDHRLRIDIPMSQRQSPFSDIRCIGNVMFIGYGEHLYVVRIQTKNFNQIKLDGYFGYLYTPDEFGLSSDDFELIVASATELFSFSADGTLNWQSQHLAVDGVRVKDIKQGTIFASGEWNPPGDWRPFAVDLANGQLIE
jgi:hypothetical protein